MLRHGDRCRLAVKKFSHVRRKFAAPGTEGVVLGLRDKEGKRQCLVKLKGFAVPLSCNADELEKIERSK